jgi:hypothetical protein
MNYNINENRPVFVQTNKTGPDRFCRFIESWLAHFIFFLKNWKILRKIKSEKSNDKLEKPRDKPENQLVYHFYSNFEFEIKNS